MSEAFKCDIKDCGRFSEGSPLARISFVQTGITKGVCENHATELIQRYFPDDIPTPDANPQP